MNAELSLDKPYHLNPRLQSSIVSPDSLAVFGPGTSVELSLDLFRVLMAFANTTTPRQVFQALDVDVNITEFAEIVADFFRRGLLKQVQVPDEEHGLHRHLNPKVLAEPGFLERISEWMQLGRAVVIPDALPIELAERVYHDLDQLSNWSVVEGGHDFFHFRTSIVSALDDRTPALAECSQLFNSTATRRFIGNMSGQDCSGKVNVAAAWYRAGEYALPHDDSAEDVLRSVAYVWYLTKHWRQEWGGAFFWCPTGQYILPRFNVLTIFKVMPSNLHLVCPVAAVATGKRLTINGFWHRAQHGFAPSHPTPKDASVSPPAYGQSILRTSEQYLVTIL